MITLRPYAVAIVIGCVSAIALATISDRLRDAPIVAPEDANTPLLVGVDPALISLGSSGHGTLYHAYLTLWTTQVMSDAAAGQVDQDTWQRSVRAMVRHRPRFETFYMAPCVMSTVRGWDEDFCLAMASLGVEEFPGSWRLALVQAYVHQMRKKDMTKAAAFYALAAASPDAPAILHGAAKYNAGDLTLEQQAERATLLMREAIGGMELQDVFDEQQKAQGESP